MDAARELFARERRACVQTRRRAGKTMLLVSQLLDDAIEHPDARLLYVAHHAQSAIRVQKLLEQEADRRVCESILKRVTVALPGADRSGYDYVYLDEVSAAAPSAAAVRAACTSRPDLRHQADITVVNITVA